MARPGIIRSTNAVEVSIQAVAPVSTGVSAEAYNPVRLIPSPPVTSNALFKFDFMPVCLN
jgi:hypothetical protein